MGQSREPGSKWRHEDWQGWKDPSQSSMSCIEGWGGPIKGEFSHTPPLPRSYSETELSQSLPCILRIETSEGLNWRGPQELPKWHYPPHDQHSQEQPSRGASGGGLRYLPRLRHSSGKGVLGNELG